MVPSDYNTGGSAHNTGCGAVLIGAAVVVFLVWGVKFLNPLSKNHNKVLFETAQHIPDTCTRIVDTVRVYKER